MIERLLSEREVAAMLALSPDSLRRLRQRGELPFVRVGRRGVRYRPEAIGRWLEERETPADAGDDKLARADKYMADLPRGV